MEEEKIKQDISKEILETTPKPKIIVTPPIAEKEERIAKGVSEIPVGTDDLEKRKKQIFNFAKRKENWIVYIILTFITYIGVYIRTRNLPRLRDITTNTWTLGPDLDPFLFLRWAKEIAINGGLPVIDFMRYVPFGYPTANEMNFLSYLIVWLYKFLSFFSHEVTVTYAAVIFPVIMFALTIIAFFLFTREIFYKQSKKIKNIIALLATAFFMLIPSLLPRTIAGIPEKESAAFFFLFMAFYFFLKSFRLGKKKQGLVFAFLAGVATALMALVWGGMIFIFFTIPPAVLLAFILGKIKKHQFILYSTWLITSFIIMIPSSGRYTAHNLLTSTSTGVAIGIFALILISFILIKFEKTRKLIGLIKLPQKISSLIVSGAIILVLAFILLGPSVLSAQIVDVKNSLITPQTSRWGLTVAENKQPYFTDWRGNFGPIVLKLPLFFWMFLIGSVALFYNLVKKIKKKERIILTFGYIVFLICLIFSRYSPNSILNGTSGLSLLIYFGGWIFFLVLCAHIYYKNYKKGTLDIFKELNFAYIMYFIIFTIGIIGARGAIRLIMMLGAISPVAIAFLVIKTSEKYFKTKDDAIKFLTGILAVILILASIFTLWNYYQSDKQSAANFAPGPYQWQWQKAMDWVKTNTSEDAVFGHWWDYGYWVQSLGERATILDGSNSIVYWNHLMGRLVLTGNNEKDALDFLYSHNGTHLLIDSTEIGKYTAFSSIGADENYDRYSWIPTFTMDEKQTQEMNNQTGYVYPGGSSLDEDIIWEKDGQEILLPKRVAGLGAILLKKTENAILQPEAIFVYNGNQYNIPLRYVYFNGELHDFKSGLDAGIFLFPRLDTTANGGVNINELGALMYLSGRTIHSNLVNLYLFGQESDYFELMHSEDSYFVENINQQGMDLGDFIYYQGFQGPIKIWEIKYPEKMEIKPEYLERNFPNQELFLAKEGEY